MTTKPVTVSNLNIDMADCIDHYLHGIFLETSYPYKGAAIITTAKV